MLFLTNFADLAVVLPLAVLVALLLAAVGWRREAVAWSVAVTCTLATVLLLKILVFAYGLDLLGDSLLSPSGHTAAGTVVYAGMLTLVGGRLATRVNIALLAGAVLALLFGLTRVMVGGHTVSDVLVGAAVGFTGVLMLARMAGSQRPGAPTFKLAVAAVIAMLAALTLHGRSLYAEAAIRSIAGEIRSAGEP